MDKDESQKLIAEEIRRANEAVATLLRDVSSHRIEDVRDVARARAEIEICSYELTGCIQRLKVLQPEYFESTNT